MTDFNLNAMNNLGRFGGLSSYGTLASSGALSGQEAGNALSGNFGNLLAAQMLSGQEDSGFGGDYFSPTQKCKYGELFSPIVVILKGFIGII